MFHDDPQVLSKYFNIYIMEGFKKKFKNKVEFSTKGEGAAGVMFHLILKKLCSKGSRQKKDQIL